MNCKTLNHLFFSFFLKRWTYSKGLNILGIYLHFLILSKLFLQNNILLTFISTFSHFIYFSWIKIFTYIFFLFSFLRLQRYLRRGMQISELIHSNFWNKKWKQENLKFFYLAFWKFKDYLLTLLWNVLYFSKQGKQNSYDCSNHLF